MSRSLVSGRWKLAEALALWLPSTTLAQCYTASTTTIPFNFNAGGFENFDFRLNFTVHFSGGTPCTSSAAYTATAVSGTESLNNGPRVPVSTLNPSFGSPDQVLRPEHRSARQSLLGCRGVPMLCTLPMGWSPSVFIAQNVHENVMYRHGVLHPSTNVVCLTSPFVDRIQHVLYIDDNILLGMDAERMRRLYDQVNAAYVEAMLPPNVAKAVWPTLDTVTTLRVDIDGRRGMISLNSGKQVVIMAATQRLCAVGL
jgi:hypothetical protein